MIQVLIDSGAYIHYEAPSGGYAISVAAFMGQAEAVKVLVNNGAFVNYNICSYGPYSRNCESPLGASLSRLGRSDKTKVFDTVEALLKLGANPNYMTSQQTPLAYATTDLDFLTCSLKMVLSLAFRFNGP